MWTRVPCVPHPPQSIHPVRTRLVSAFLPQCQSLTEHSLHKQNYFNMRKLTVLLAAASLSAVSFAQTLSPASGVYYPEDINNSGIVRVEFEDAVENPTAVITYNGQTVNASMYEQGNTGRFWAVQIQEALSGVLTENGTEITLTVNGDNETVSGTYKYMPVFPLVSITPDAYSTVESKTFNAVFTFNQTISYSSIKIASGENTKTIAAGSGSVITVPITESDWGTASTKQNLLSVQINDVTLADGTHISNIGGQEAAIGSTYSYDEPIGFEFIGVSPTEDEATYQEVYDDYWYVEFMFTEAVELPEDEDTTCATVTFYDRRDDELCSVNLTSWDVFGNWNYRAGYYSIQVAIPEVPDDADGYSSATVELKNVKYNGNALSVMPSVTYLANLSKSTPHKSKGSTASIELIDSESHTNDVYSLEGTLVIKNASKEDLKSLERGLYIINGNKIVIR